MPLVTRLSFSILAIASVALALFSLRYLAPGWPGAPETVAQNPYAHPWLTIHAGAAAIALLLSPFQLMTTPGGQRRAWHKASGRVYVIACLIGAPSGLILAFGATTGPVSTAGFGTLAVIWFYANAMGWKAALDHSFEDHRRWMIRSLALTFGAILLRLYLPIAPMLGYSFDDGYRIISFASWVPNLIVAETLLRGPLKAWPSPRRPRLQA